VETEAADDAMAGEALEETKDGGLVALVGEAGRGGELGERHGTIIFQEGEEEFLKGLGAAQSGVAAALDGLLEKWAHVHDCMGMIGPGGG